MKPPLEFFQEHMGVLIDPEAAPMDVLMRAYPHGDPAKSISTRMGGSEPARMLVSEGEAKLWAPIAVPEHARSRIEVAPTSARKRRDWLVDVIMNPPKPPFLAVSIGMAASDVDFWRMTVSEDMIVFSGAAALHDGDNVAAVDRRKFIAAKEWFAQTQTPVSDLLRRRDILHKFKTGTWSGAASKAAMARIKTPAAVMDTYAGPADAFQMKLAYYAANEWVPE